MAAHTPALTVVVTGHDVEGRLRPCLASILTPATSEVEVVYVDDASTDNSLWVAQDVARRDPRVRVVRTQRRRGSAGARARGTVHARGDHVLFVDGDAALTPGAVATLLDQLREAPAELVLFDHARVTWDGKRHRDGRPRDLAELAGGPPVRLADHPRLLARRPVVWDRVYRRSLLARLHPLPPDDGVPFSHAALLEAVDIGAVDRVLYLEHTPWRGRAPRPPAPAAVVTDHETTAAWLDDDPARDRWRPLVAQRLLVDLVDALLAASGPAPDAVARGAEVLRRIAPEDPPAATAAADVELASLVLAGDRAGYLGRVQQPSVTETAAPASGARRGSWRRRLRAPLGRLRRHVRTTTGRLRTRYALAWYAHYRRRPVDPRLAVFAAYWYRGYACNPRAVHEELRRRAPDIRTVWVVEDRTAGGVPEDVVTVRPGTRRYYRALGTARWLVNNVNFPNHYVKREGTTFLQTHHGTPLKKMGLDSLHHGGAAQKPVYYRRVLERSEAWDLMLSSNRHSTEVWRRAFPVPAEILEYGYPRNDALVNATAQDRTEARRRLGIDDERRVVLFAPTFRDRRRPFDPQLDLVALLDTLPGDSVLLLRSHHFVADSVTAVADPRILDVSQVPDVTELCLAADVLVSDYSSIVVDFALLRRPIVLYAPDLDTYAGGRGLYVDLTTEGPGPVVRTAAELGDALRDADAPGHRAAAERFRRRFGEFDDGRAAARVVGRVFLDG